VSESLETLANEISTIERRVSDALYDALRAQVRDEDAENAKELEKRLAKVRRSLMKAESLLRGASDD
jgi:Mg2+ and Co2+ transporter CorA